MTTHSILLRWMASQIFQPKLPGAAKVLESPQMISVCLTSDGSEKPPVIVGLLASSGGGSLWSSRR